MLRDIEKLIKQKLPQEVIAGFEPYPNAVAHPFSCIVNNTNNPESQELLVPVARRLKRLQPSAAAHLKEALTVNFTYA
jgi:hypothetical protein